MCKDIGLLCSLQTWHTHCILSILDTHILYRIFVNNFLVHFFASTTFNRRIIKGQAKLHVRHGGLRLRTATDLTLPVFLSSRAASSSLVNYIIHQPTNTPEDNKEVRAWLYRNIDLTNKQSLTNKEIRTIFSALQPSPPWLHYSTSIVWSVSRRLHILSLAPS